MEELLIRLKVPLLLMSQDELEDASRRCLAVPQASVGSASMPSYSFINSFVTIYQLASFTLKRINDLTRIRLKFFNEKRTIEGESVRKGTN